MKLASLLLILSLGMCACGARGPYPISPRYTPTSSPELGAVRTTNSTLVIQAVVDGRSDVNSVGHTTESSPARKISAPQAKVVNLVGYAFTRELRSAGFRVEGTGDVHLTITILELWVEEDNTYNGSARFKVDIAQAGKPVRSLTITGSAKRWGSSVSEENYNEVLSDSLVSALENLLKSRDFHGAIDR